jgi:hypothetical protein
MDTVSMGGKQLLQKLAKGKSSGQLKSIFKKFDE